MSKRNFLHPQINLQQKATEYVKDSKNHIEITEEIRKSDPSVDPQHSWVLRIGLILYIMDSTSALEAVKVRRDELKGRKLKRVLSNEENIYRGKKRIVQKSVNKNSLLHFSDSRQFIRLRNTSDEDKTKKFKVRTYIVERLKENGGWICIRTFIEEITRKISKAAALARINYLRNTPDYTPEKGYEVYVKNCIEQLKNKGIAFTRGSGLDMEVKLYFYDKRCFYPPRNTTPSELKKCEKEKDIHMTKYKELQAQIDKENEVIYDNPIPTKLLEQLENLKKMLDSKKLDKQISG